MGYFDRPMQSFANKIEEVTNTPREAAMASARARTA